jgi:hypothetical protein
MSSNLFVYFNFEKVTVLSMWALSLTRGQVCRLSVSPLSLSVYIYTVYVQNIIEIVLNIQYVESLCQSRLSTADYALLLVAFATTAVLDTWTVVCLTAVKQPMSETLSYYIYTWDQAKSMRAKRKGCNKNKGRVFLHILPNIQTKLSDMSVDFDIIDELLIRYSTFFRYWKRKGSEMR